MKRSAKLADVARAAGVSQGTASNAFNRPELVRPEVRARVEASARRLGYAGPDPRGRALRAGKANLIGIVSAGDTAYSFRDLFMRQVMAGIADECDAHGAGMALVSARGNSEAAWRIQTAVVDGFIVNCLRVGEDLISLARERKLPFVSIDLDAGPGTSSILVEDRRGGYAAARHLLELGHRRFGLLALETGCVARFGWVEAGRLRGCDLRFARDRVAGYADALAERGIALEDLAVMEAPNDRDAAVPYAAELLAARPETTAILAMSDVLAFAAIDAARSRGLRVPEDLSVVGFDDVPEAATSSPPLTTVSQPAVEKGRLAARLILEPGPPRAEVLPVKLVVRGSTAPRAGDLGVRASAAWNS
jgi:DNA-binding LacI/PurR family transcriptional regulator